MSVLPTRKNFTIWKGADFRHRFTMHTGADASTPVKNLTGHTAFLEIRAQAGTGSPLQSLTTENNGITLGGALGTIDLLIPAATTAGITWKQGVYDLILVGSSPNSTDAILYGNFVVHGV